MPKAYNVDLDIFRGASIRPVGCRRMQILADSLLHACCRAEEITNVTVRDNEYAACSAIVPIPDRQPSVGMVLTEAA